MRVGDALSVLTGESGVSSYRSARFVVPLGPLRLVFPNPGKLPLHDLHHVALGVPMTFWGEVEVSVFEIRSGVPSALIALLCVSAIALGSLLAPCRVRAWWRQYRGCKNAYAEAARYHWLLDLSVNDLRHELLLDDAPDRR